MALADLRVIAFDYENSYLGQSDKTLAKIVLDLLVDILAAQETNIDTLDSKIDELDTKIDALETRVETLEA